VLTAAHSIRRVATKSKSIDAIATFDVAAPRGLLSQHAWIGAIVPCHSHCGPTHAAQLLVHVLCMACVVSAVLTAYSSLADGDVVVVVVFGLAGAVSAAALRSIVAVPFGMYRVIDRRREHSYRSPTYRPQDAILETMGVNRLAPVGLSKRTMTECADIVHDEAGDLDAPLPAVVPVPVLPPRHDLAHGRNMKEGVTIVARGFATGGFALCFIVSVATGSLTMWNTAPWCGRRIAVFERTLIAALLIDAVVVSPVTVLCIWLWRWMVSDEADGRAVHDLHPIDGHWRIVGLHDDCEEEPCDDGNAQLAAYPCGVEQSPAEQSPAAQSPADTTLAITAPKLTGADDIDADEL
jgi:hypothetical protein